MSRRLQGLCVVLSLVVSLSFGGSTLQAAWAGELVPQEVLETTTGAASESSAEALIKRFVLEVEAARRLPGEDPYSARFARLVPIVSGTFDMHTMSGAIVGRSVWRLWTAEEQDNFANVMTELLSATIAGRLEIETDHPTEVLQTVPGPGDSKVVRTLSTQNGEAIRVDYRLVPRDGKWLIVDIVADAKVSEVARRRAEFLGIIQAQGHAGIIAAIEKKISQLDQSGA